MTRRRYSIPYVLVVGGTVLSLAAILLFFLVGCIAAPLEVYLGVPSAVTFAVLLGGPALFGAVTLSAKGIRLLPWGSRSPGAALALTLRFGAAYPGLRRDCRDTEATPVARFAVRHAAETETARSDLVSARALIALCSDADDDIRAAAERHFRCRVETGGHVRGEQPWQLTEELPPEAARRIAAGLLDSGDEPDPRAVNLAWRLWLSEGDDELWQALRRRRPIPGGALTRLAQLTLGLRDPGEQFDAATDPAVPLVVRQRCAEHCAEAGLVPPDPVAAVSFFLRAGCLSRYRRLDTDGSLLVLANHSLHPAERLHLRAVLTELGEVELLRALRHGRDGDPFADGRADPARLWRALLDEPLLEAVRYAPRLDDRLPEPAEQRRLLHRLRSHDVEELDELLADLDEVGDRPLRQPAIRHQPATVAFTADGTRLLLGFNARPPRFREFDTVTGALLRDWTGAADSTVVETTYTDSALIVSFRDRSGPKLDRYRLPPDDLRSPVREVLRHHGAAGHRHLRRRRDGFLAAAAATIRVWGPADELLATIDGRVNGDIRLLAYDPDEDRVAVSADREVAVHDVATGAELARATLPHRPDAILLLDGAELVTARKTGEGRIEVSRWAAAENRFTPRTSHILVIKTRALWKAAGIRLHRRGATGVVVSHGDHYGDFTVGVDARSMTDLPLELSFAEHVIGASADGLDLLTRVVSGEGDRYLLRRFGSSPLLDMFETPLSQLTLADLRVLDRERPLTPEASRPVLDLLRDCLRYRFATEIALGDPVTGTDYDIGLGEAS